ncbi:unnamed protein product, partial [marine sediment metagenome]
PPNVGIGGGGDFEQDATNDQYGGNIRGVWEHEISDTSSTKVQTYMNFNSFTIPDDNIDFRLDWNLFDIDFQHNFEIEEENTVVWGLGYRRNHFTSRGTAKQSYVPSRRNVDFLSGFIQDSFPISDK